MECKDCKNKEAKQTLDVGRGCKFCQCEGEVGASPCSGCFKLHTYDWLEEFPNVFPDDVFEVRFKNTRRGYYKNVNNLPLKQGDVVAVEASPGHDIGIVSLSGDIVGRQMKRVGFNPLNGEFKKIYRKAKPYDIEKWQEAIAMEHETMIRSRQIASELNLNMKIGDVEYQGDKIKAIFYYIADERVDFRELIKIFADQFRIRVEMKQIGARQEAGRIGGLGSCGRELCCASWISNFVSVTTNSARHQEISLNPQKLAGQCGKLKCCLVYEVDTYLDARKDFPRVNQPLQTIEGDYYLIKNDILNRIMWFSSDPHSQANMVSLRVERVREVMRMNQKGIKAEQLNDTVALVQEQEPTYANVVGEESLTRFDQLQTNRRKNRKKRKPQSADAKSDVTPDVREERKPRPSSNKPDNRPSGNKGNDSGENKDASAAKPNRRQGNNRPPRREGATSDGSTEKTQPQQVSPPTEQSQVRSENGGQREGAPRRNNNRNRRRNPNRERSGGSKPEGGAQGGGENA